MSPALGAQSLNHRTVSASVSMGIDAQRQSEGVRGVVGKGGGCSRWDPEQGTTVGNQGSVLRGTCDRPSRNCPNKEHRSWGVPREIVGTF